MGSLSIWHWLIVIGVAVVLFVGKGKISSVMGDFAKGIKAFKAGMKEPEEDAVAPVAQVPPPAGAARKWRISTPFLRSAASQYSW